MSHLMDIHFYLYLVNLEQELPCRRPRFDPWVGRSPGEGNGNPLQYSCVENPMDRGVWQATVHRVAESQTQQSDFTVFLFCLEEGPSLSQNAGATSTRKPFLQHQPSLLFSLLEEPWITPGLSHSSVICISWRQQLPENRGRSRHMITENAL